MSDDATASVPAAWYPDPQSPSRLRWWDGQAWTTNLQELPPPPAAAPRPLSGFAVPPNPELPSRLAAVDGTHDTEAEFVVRVDLTEHERELAAHHQHVPTAGSRPPDRVIAEARRRAARGITRLPANPYQPHDTSRPASERDDNLDIDADDDIGSPMTVEIWVIALLPLLVFVAIYLATPLPYFPHNVLTTGVLVGALVILSVILAGSDRASLKQRNQAATVHPFVAIVPPLYLLVRTVRVSISSILPLVAWLLIAGVVYATLAQSPIDAGGWGWAVKVLP